MATYRYACDVCGKTYIGPQVDSMMCNCDKPKKLIGKLQVAQVAPLSPQLSALVLSSEAGTTRAALCTQLGVVNKSHAQHGANFSSNQTLVNLINDIVAPLMNVPHDAVRQAVITHYKYDIDSQMMT